MNSMSIQDHQPTDARERLLSPLPVTERRPQLAGGSTAVLEGGDGPPIVLLHAPGDPAFWWMRVVTDLVTTHRVIVPDLPGRGTSEIPNTTLDADSVVTWLGELVEQTCPTPPTLVGPLLGGAIAARVASDRSDRRQRLVLVDAFGFERISVPTTLIWGRDDRATRLGIADDASARDGWPLHVIDDAGDDPTLERPDVFLRTLDTALETPDDGAHGGQR